MENIRIVFFFIIISATFSNCDPKSAESSEDMGSMSEMPSSEEDERPSPLKNISGSINGKEIQLQYGAPSVKNREIWGDLVPYDVVWRTGANEATFIELKDSVDIKGGKLAPGKYSIFTIPKEKGDWTVIFNTDWDLEHGHFQYNENNDILKVSVSPENLDDLQEVLSFEIADSEIILKWEKIKLTIPVQ